MNEDGRMARLDDLFKFSEKHKIKLASIEDIISYRLQYEKLISRINSKAIIFKDNEKVQIYSYKNKLGNNINFAITKGNLSPNKSTLVRVLSTKIKNNNILNNNEIKKTLRFLSKYKNYLLLIINNSSKTNDENINTLRYYGIGAQIIKDLKVKNMILISRRRKKIIGLEGFGLKIIKDLKVKNMILISRTRKKIIGLEGFGLKIKKQKIIK